MIDYVYIVKACRYDSDDSYIEENISCYISYEDAEDHVDKANYRQDDILDWICPICGDKIFDHVSMLQCKFPVNQFDPQEYFYKSFYFVTRVPVRSSCVPDNGWQDK